MHAAAVDWLVETSRALGVHGAVLEFGSLNINGTARECVPHDSWLGVDLVDGTGVDLIADAATITVGRWFDVVVCCEVFEHTVDADAIVANAARHLHPGGVLLATMAGTSRAPHSAVDGNALRAGEFYRNVSRADLSDWLADAGFVVWHIDERGDDLRCWARR